MSPRSRGLGNWQYCKVVEITPDGLLKVETSSILYDDVFVLPSMLVIHLFNSYNYAAVNPLTY